MSVAGSILGRLRREAGPEKTDYKAARWSLEAARHALVQASVNLGPVGANTERRTELTMLANEISRHIAALRDEEERGVTPAS